MNLKNETSEFLKLSCEVPTDKAGMIMSIVSAMNLGVIHWEVHPIYDGDKHFEINLASQEKGISLKPTRERKPNISDEIEKEFLKGLDENLSLSVLNKRLFVANGYSNRNIYSKIAYYKLTGIIEKIQNGAGLFQFVLTPKGRERLTKLQSNLNLENEEKHENL